MTGSETTAQGGIQVIARAASIFRALEAAGEGLSLSALSRATGLPRTTVHRMVGALEQEHLLALVDGRVRLGPALPRLAGAGQADIAEIARPQIESLALRSGETVKLSLLRGSLALLVDQVVSEQELRVVSIVGATAPLVSTAQGHVLLAGLPDEDIARRLEKPWALTTPDTRTDLAAVMQAVSEARARGWALEKGEHLAGICSLARPLELPLPERYALSVSLPTARLPADPAHLQAALALCARSIETSF